MLLDNQTRFDAELIHGPAGRDRHGVAVVVKASHPLRGGKIDAAEPTFVWPVSRQELKTDYGDFPMDHHFPVAKMDFMVCGDAHGAKGRMVRDCHVLLQVGDFNYRQHIFGDRVWQKTLMRYQPSDPRPFSRLPLTLAAAFGGEADMPMGVVRWPENPLGKGVLFEGLDPRGRPLPNIERPGDYMADPFDKPRPTCMTPYPLGWKLRLDSLMEAGSLPPFRAEDSHLYFGQAHPDLMMNRLAPGTRVHLRGMDPEGELAFDIPENRLEAIVSLDGRETPMRVTLDAVCIFARHATVGFKYRAATTINLEPRQLRRVLLRERGS